MNEKGLREYSREAKARLVSGFWQERKEERALAEAVDEAAAAQSGLHVETTATEDPLFMKKVAEIVENEEFISNPLRLLMDDTELDGLDFEGRQRYIFQLSERYTAAKQRILAERGKKDEPIR